MQITLQTLTPVHIGSGSKLINGLDFEIRGDKCYIFDPNKIIDLIGDNRIDQWVSAINENKPLFEFLKTNSINYSPEDISSRILTMLYPNAQATDLNECIKTCNMGAYIPGSSLKGAIRTLLVKNTVESTTKISEKDFHYYDERRRRDYFKDRELENKFFGRNATDKPWRTLQVGDCHFSDIKTKIAEVKILNLNGSNQFTTYDFKPQNLLVEVIPANQITSFKLKINETLSLLNQGKARNSSTRNEYFRHHHGLNNIRGLFKIINQETSKIIKKEIDDWNIEKRDYTGNFDILETYNKIYGLLKELNQSESCIIRVGGHSGWRFTTGGWILELNEKQMSDDIWFKLRKVIRKKVYEENIMTPKTRKTTPDGNLLGFIKLSLK